MRELTLGPMLAVRMPRSEVRLWPWNDQEIDRGSSPSLTTQVNWANAPSFMTFEPKLKGIIEGGSGKKYFFSFYT